ncbi:PcfJ domain-containing protein [Deltaproteobacteria bacterium OttesenSCG-928-M10]|nr:PcfJ domain-containing protein [Deltaproteobacteria bacterium OttesenSCG-928-M10]MDL2260010.1 PcfJ domain-containing protein [Deltaproteobacteria bacterium OttesenSCG-928-K17]
MDEILTARHHLDHERYYAELYSDSDFLHFVGFAPSDNYPVFSNFKKEYEPGILSALETIQQTVSRWKMLGEPVIEQRDGWVTMTIGNVWRLVKRADQREIALWEYCIVSRRWRSLPLDEFTHVRLCRWFQRPAWPDIKCIEWGRGSFSPHSEQALAAIYYVVCKLGLADRLQADAESGHVWKLNQLKEACGKLVDHYRNWAAESGQDVYAIRKGLWRHFLDRDLMFVLCTKNYGMPVNMHSYLKAMDQADHLFRLARESRNFLPMLNIIPKSMWPRADLLKDETLRECPALAGLSNSALRWLRRAPCSVLCKLYYHKALPQTVEVLSRLNLERKVPAMVQRCIVQRCWALEGFERVPTEIIRLFRLFAAHCLEIRDQKGLKAMKRFLRQRRVLHLVLDWFWAEGLERGLPGKNATWASLVRHSYCWHDQFRENEANLAPTLPPVTWDSPLPKTTIGNVVVRPLDSSQALIQEGQTMRHCVSSYVPQCLRGYRIFSLTEPDGTRSTLGLRPSQEGWQLDQHYGVGNSRVSAASAHTAKLLLLLCNHDHKSPAKDMDTLAIKHAEVVTQVSQIISSVI